MSDELPDALFAADPDGTAELFLAAFLLLTGEVLFHRLLQHARRELRGVDRESDGAVFDFFLHGDYSFLWYVSGHKTAPASRPARG